METDPATVYTLGGVVASMLALVSWVVRELVTRSRDTGEYVRAATGVLVELRGEVGQAKEQSEKCLEKLHNLEAKLDARPCALVQHPGLLDARPCALVQHPGLLDALRPARAAP
jgi:hypothetical protein